MTAAQDELTIGTILSGTCFLLMLAVSLRIGHRWWQCLRRGRSPVPAAERSFHFVPLPLLVFGLLTALFISANALSVSVSQSAPPTSELTEKTLRSILRQTIVLDIFLTAVLGIPLILLNSSRRQAEVTFPSADFPADSVSADRPPIGTVGRTVRAWNFPTELKYAAETCAVAWLPVVALRLLVAGASESDNHHPLLELVATQPSDGVLLLTVAAAAVLAAPVTEELLYRVIILGGLLNDFGGQNPTSPAAAIAVSSLLFAFAHGFPDSIALLPLAVLIGWIYFRRRSYRTVVLIHLLFNAFNILLAGLGML